MLRWRRVLTGFWWGAALLLPSAAAQEVERLELALGELQTLSVQEPTRVAISDPKVADVTIISSQEVLLQAKEAGTTNVLLWDANGQRTVLVTVISTEPVSPTGDQLVNLLRHLKLETVRVEREGPTFFLIGEVAEEYQLEQLERMLDSYPNAKNLVVVQKPIVLPPPPESAAPLVRLGVQIVELRGSASEQLGVDWADGVGFTEQSFSVGEAGEVDRNKALINLNESIAKRVGEPFRVGRLFRQGFTATVNFLASHGKARVLAEPTLVTASGKPATSFMGSEIPIVTASNTSSGGAVSTQIEFREIGVKLTMTPTILASQEKINTTLNAEITGIDTARQITVGSGGSSTATVPGFRTRRAETEVVTGSGETIVIAGLLQTEDSETVSEVPGLGRMPIVGRLFRTPSTSNEQTELVIAVTPELVQDASVVADKRLALEQALASAEVLAAVEDPRLRYALSVQERISKALRYPQREKELNLEGMVKLRLHVFQDGTLGRAMVTESSGISAFDTEALKAAESQSPFPGFPSQLIERELWLEVPVIFRPT